MDSNLKHVESSESLSDRARAHYRLGNTQLAANAPEAAAQSYRHALSLEPTDVRAHNNLGQALLRLGRTVEAVGCFERAIALDPRYVIAYNNLGTAHFALGQFEQALVSLNVAIELDPGMVEAHFNRGNALRKLKRSDEAVVSYQRVIHLRPTLVAAHLALGNALHAMQRLELARESYRNALRLDPAHTMAGCNEAGVLLEMGLLQQALQRCDETIALRPESAHAFNLRGGILRALGRQEEAGHSFAHVRQIDPQFDLALGRLVHARQNCCDWTDYERDVSELDELITQGRKVANPFSVLSVLPSARQQLLCAQSFARAEEEPGRPSSVHPIGPADRKIRLAYLSGDLREHAVSYLMAGVLEKHDRRRFELVALSLNPPDASLMGRRVAAAFDRFIDISRLGDAEVGSLIRDLGVDILVDLVGFSQYVRLGILAQHAAPVQVNYLGHPGTMGAAYMDYIFADPFLVPPGSCEYYAEKVVFLPECFQANDDQRAIATAPTRAQAGLPEEAFVFCAFSGSHKITPMLFSLWCRLLRARPSSVLWLVADNDVARKNLVREALARGVDEQQLIFAERQPYAQHLARLSLADLVLDTFPFNGGTTASDALWAGVPLLTRTGDAFASRMAGSLLRTLGLEELITADFDAYERVALALSESPSRLNDLRRRLHAARTASPLFRTEPFCRQLEAAYIMMWQRAEARLPPASFSVSAPSVARA